MSGGPEETRAGFEDWKRLDLDPGADERTARAAYARKLKQTRPDVDPEGFQALRQSFELVLEEIRSGAATDAARGVGAGGQGEADAVDPAAVADVLRRFSSRRRRGDSAGALAVLDEAFAGTLRLRWRQAIEDGLLADVAQDPSIRLGLLRALADRFDWREATGRHAEDERMGPLRERVQSADALELLRERVAAARAGAGAPGERVLVTIFGPYRPGLFDKALPADEAAVAEETMNAFFQHAEVDGLIDPRMLAAVRSALGAAPVMSELPPPPDVSAKRAQAAPSGMTGPPDASAAERFPKWIVIAAVLFFLNLARHTGQLYSAPDHSTDGTYRPSYDRVMGTSAIPSLPRKLEVGPGQGGRRIVQLEPLASGNLRNVRAVRIASQPVGDATDIAVGDLAAKPSFELPAGAKAFSIQYLMNDGDRSEVETFDLGDGSPGGDDPGGAKP